MVTPAIDDNGVQYEGELVVSAESGVPDDGPASSTDPVAAADVAPPATRLADVDPAAIAAVRRYNTRTGPPGGFFVLDGAITFIPTDPTPELAPIAGGPR